MSDPGFVYVLVNPSHQGLVKVGRSERDPQERAKELSSSTGVALPFFVAYQEHFPSCSQAERLLHERLTSKGTRVSANREFFRAPLHEVIKEINVLKGQIGEDDSRVSSSGVSRITPVYSKELELQVDQAWELCLGTNGKTKDINKGLQMLESAAAKGSERACYLAGVVYEFGFPNREKFNEYMRKCIDYLGEHTEKAYHSLQRDLRMAGKYKELQNLTLEQLQVWIENFPKDVPYVAQRYISDGVEFSLPMKERFWESIRPFKKDVIQYLSDAVDEAIDDDAEQEFIEEARTLLKVARSNLK